MFASRIRCGAGALAISGILFLIYPALRPFSDERSLLGAAAFGSGAWLASHMLAIVAFTLLPLGLLGLQRSLLGTSAERLLFVAVVLSMVGIGFTLPFYGGETYGLHALGQEALRLHSDAPLGLAEVIRSGPGLVMFLAGLLLLAASAIVTATALWRSCRYPKASGIPFAVGISLYIPQFFGAQPLRVAHGLLLAAGCVWMAACLWRQGQVESVEDNLAEQVTIFFYGLFMDPEALEAKGLRPSRPRQAFVERFALILAARATLRPGGEGRVYGTIMRLTHAEVDQLYSEPSVAAYRPEPVLARLTDGTAELALCFNLPAAPQGPIGNPEYAAALQAVARKIGLPDEYIAEIPR